MKKEISKQLENNVEFWTFKKIRDITISSLVIQIIALVLGVVGCLGVAYLIYENSSKVQTLNGLINVLINLNNVVWIGLIGGFLLLSFISFFLLSTIAACKYGTRLSAENKDVSKLLILLTPASLVFLPLVVILWPIFALVVIGKTDYRMKKIIKNLSVEKENKSKIVDLTGTGIKKDADETNVVNPNSTTTPAANRVVNQPYAGTVYRPGQSMPQNHNPNRIYIRTPGSNPVAYPRPQQPSGAYPRPQGNN